MYGLYISGNNTYIVQKRNNNFYIRSDDNFCYSIIDKNIYITNTNKYDDSNYSNYEEKCEIPDNMISEVNSILLSEEYKFSIIYLYNNVVFKCQYDIYDKELTINCSGKSNLKLWCVNVRDITINAYDESKILLSKSEIYNLKNKNDENAQIKFIETIIHEQNGFKKIINENAELIINSIPIIDKNIDICLADDFVLLT